MPRPVSGTQSPAHAYCDCACAKRSLRRLFHTNLRTKLRQRAGLTLRLPGIARSEEHTSELQSRLHLVCRLLLEKKNSMQLPCHHGVVKFRYFLAATRLGATNEILQVVRQHRTTLLFARLFAYTRTVFAAVACLS